MGHFPVYWLWAFALASGAAVTQIGGMIEIEDIRDRGSLEKWLIEWPKENRLGEKTARAVSVTIANRVVMRVLPFWWQWCLTEDAGKLDLTALSILRSDLTSGIVGKMPTSEEVKKAAVEAAVKASFDAGEAAATACAAAIDAVYASEHAGEVAADVYYSPSFNSATAATVAAIATAKAAAAAKSASVASSSAFWASLQSDCEKISNGEDAISMPLWLNRENPFEEIWREIVSEVKGSEWAFWIKWYEDALQGRPQNWQMLEQIALIDPKIWEAGAEAVAKRIAEIELEHAVLATPNAEDIQINEAGKYEAVARSSLPSRTLQDANDRIGDVIRQIRAAQAASNQYSALSPEADLLEDVQTRYGENALRLHEVCFKVIRHVGGYVSDGVLPENDNLIGDVTGDLQNTADDIYNFDGEAKKAIDARARLRFGKLSDDDKARILALTEAVAVQSEDSLAQELREDAQAIAGEAEPSEETSVNRYRLGSRLVLVATVGGALIGVETFLSQVEGAVSGAQYLFAIIRPLLGL